MSFQAMTWAVNIDLPVKQKMVLMMLANRTDPDTNRCFPSLEKLARDCGMSKTSVKEGIRALKEAGFVVVHERRVGEVNLSNEYELPIPESQGVGRNTPGGGAQYARGVGRNTPPKLSSETINEPITPDGDLFGGTEPESKVIQMPDQDAQFEAFWKAFPTRPNPSSKKNTRGKFRIALRKVAFPDLMRATEAYAESRRGEDQNYTKGAEPWLNGEFWSVWLNTEKPESKYQRIIREAKAAKGEA